MNRLSSRIESIKPHYDVVIIGSGYGGSITASRLSRAGLKVCVLERGKERQPGEFPSTVLEAAEELQIDLPECHKGSRTGLFDIRVNREISVLVGCGLGGTSLINANVSFRPDMRIFEDPRWPAALRAENGERLSIGFELAEKMLGANPYPSDKPRPPKLVALQRSAEAMGKRFYSPPINVTFTEGYNYAGVRQKACTLCGDCASGCNHGAKNTVLMNYLPDAKRHGAEIFVETGVRWVERGANNTWTVHFQLLNTGRESYNAPTLFVSADIVILAAGALGSTEILMRSRDSGHLKVSDRLGHGFGGNGDLLGFGYNGTPEIRSVGLGQGSPEGNQHLDEGRAIGPCISGVIDMRGNADWRTDMIVEEGAIPGSIAAILPGTQRTAALFGGINTSPSHTPAQQARELASAVRGPYHGATAHTQIYLGMCHDGSNGSMALDTDRLRIHWPNVGHAPIFAELNQRLIDATRPLEGVYIPSPLWSDALGKSLLTVHPLGGCNLADSAETGVVDHRCKVFSGSTGTDVHEGLYVCDGAIVPTAVGVNPLLTISALAERCCMIIAEERGLTIDYTQKGPIRSADEPRTAGVRFTERMKGWFSSALAEDYAAAARQGQAEGSSFEFVVTIVSDDVDTLINDPSHEARMAGTVSAPRLSPSPLVVTQGVFNLFVQDPTSPGTRLMKYRMLLSAEDGRTYTFTGFKTLRDSPFWKLWRDSTTLFITIHEGLNESGPVVGKGVLTIAPDDFVRLLATIDVTDAVSRAERIETTVKFGRYFAGSLYDKYGGIAAFPRRLDGAVGYSFADGEDEGAPRKRRPLRVSAPDFVPIQASDGAEILLTRHNGGAKGPVVLAHGLGSASKIFSTDTTDTNLLEYLFAAGYDVWLFDFRGSDLLPAPRTPHTADDVAQKDWPAAVAAVRAATGAASVQVVAHCLGSATFAMAMLSGLSGVRSAVCSQLATHLVAPKHSALTAGIYAPHLGAALSFESLSAFAEGKEDWVSPLYARAIEVDAAGKEQMCEVEACNRLTFLYGPVYEHGQLTEATHASLYELFGDAPVELLESVSTMVKKGHVTDAAGMDVYLPHIERLAIPIRFIHGAENKCFLPASTEKAMEILSEKNGSTFYSRHVIAGYGHSDCLVGKNAAIDVYPHILEHLEKT